MHRNSADLRAFVLGAIQSAIWAACLRLYSVVAGVSQAGALLTALAFVGLFLGGTTPRTQPSARARWMEAALLAVLVFLLASDLYQPNLFDLYFFETAHPGRYLAFAAALGGLVLPFRAVGRSYGLVLAEAPAPARNYAAFAGGFAAGTLAVAGLSAFVAPDVVLALGLAALVAEGARAQRATLAPVLLLGVALAAGRATTGVTFDGGTFLFGARDYQRLGREWSPYHKLDFVAIGGGKVLACAYNSVLMWITAPDFGPILESAPGKGAVYEAVFVEPPRRVLVMGSGGGIPNPYYRDPRVERIVAVELDPVAVRRMTTDLASWNGGFYLDPKVVPLAREGRAYLARSQETFDFIDYDSLETYAYALAGTIVPIERALFTQEGLAAAVARLDPHGVLHVSIGTDDVDTMIRPVVQSLPEGMAYLVVRHHVNLGFLGVRESTRHGAELEGYGSRELPLAVVLASRDPGRIAAISASLRTLATNVPAPVQVLEEGVVSAASEIAPITDDRPFQGTPPPGWTPSVLAAVALLAAAPFLSRPVRAHKRAWPVYVPLGMGYLALQTGVLVRGCRAFPSPIVGTLVLVALFLAGNVLVNLLAHALSGRLARASALLAPLGVAAGLAIARPALASAPTACLLSLALGAAGGWLWPVSLASLPPARRRLALALDAYGALPGVIAYQGLLYGAGFVAADRFAIGCYVLAAVALVAGGARPGAPEQ